MPAYQDPSQRKAEARAERHARAFAESQPPVDPQVLRLAADGYNLHQIAMLTRIPMIDVRMMLAGKEGRL